MSYGSVDGLEFSAQQAHVEDSLALQRAARAQNNNPTGECEDCGEEIPAARLRVIPNAACCVQCQSIRDRTPRRLFTYSNPYVP